ncbi:MAG: HAMP domain-containing protein [uncultured Sulfurovum sp.]|uniref:histidine kinase n=1 Tax=uncultured Sulfurovum sp. TaxID=269237 RepID=A0A6S6TPV1_9BACT|nr:MAG: HAMP domain-containing protein [uncultured Sulfurovum sp.]
MIKTLWCNFSDTYRIFISMLLLILTIQLGTLLYIWTFKSEVLLEKERQSLKHQLESNAKRLSEHFTHLQKELEFLAILEVMDDVLANDVDKRIGILLEKKAKDLGEGIGFFAYKSGEKVVASSQEHYVHEDSLIFTAPIVASFEKEKILGELVLLYPYKNLMDLKVDNPHQKLWLEAEELKKKFDLLNEKESIVVFQSLEGKLKGWTLFLSHEKVDAFVSIRQIQRIILWGFLLSLMLILFVVFVLYRKQIGILEHTEEALELKRTFLSTMSHELRTPLGSILSLTQHLMTSSQLNEGGVVMLNKIESASEHLLSMINNLLQLSKLESNSMHVEEIRVDMIVVIEEIIEMLEPLIDEKDLHLEKQLLEGEEFIVTDVNLFRQVIMNLLSNAIKFTHEGSISIVLTQENEAFVLTIKDTGIGIALDKQASLFSEFYQAHMGKEEIKHSTGLGLALSQKVAKLIKGEIGIKSEGRGKGCEATFRFSSL